MTHLSTSIFSRAARRFRRVLDRRALILLYHRVADEEADPWQLAVSPRRFEEHLQVLSGYVHRLSVRDLAAAIIANRLPRRSVAVTFDDGYVDNLLNAKPLLEKYGVPATVFVSSAFLNGSREFWWETLDTIFLRAGTLPDLLRLNVDGCSYEWSLDGSAEYPRESFANNIQWRPWHQSTPTARHALYRQVYEVMQPLPGRTRFDLTEQLKSWAPNGDKPESPRRAMSKDELQSLATGGLIEVGCHTASHSLLSRTSILEQEQEVQESKRDLEQIVGSRVTSFAYPYGKQSDYAADTIRIVQLAGFRCACSSSDGIVRANADLFQLPRIQITEMDGEQLSRKLREWLES